MWISYPGSGVNMHIQHPHCTDLSTATLVFVFTCKLCFQGALRRVIRVRRCTRVCSYHEIHNLFIRENQNQSWCGCELCLAWAPAAAKSLGAVGTRERKYRPRHSDSGASLPPTMMVVPDVIRGQRFGDRNGQNGSFSRLCSY